MTENDAVKFVGYVFALRMTVCVFSRLSKKNVSLTGQFNCALCTRVTVLNELANSHTSKRAVPCDSVWLSCYDLSELSVI